MPRRFAGRHCTGQKSDLRAAGGSRALWEERIIPARRRDRERARL